MANLFLIAVVTPLAILVLSIVGVIGGRTQSVAIPARSRRKSRRAPRIAAVRRADRRHRRDYFGDFAPAHTLDTLGTDADVHATPPHGASTVGAPIPSPTAQARPGDSLTAFASGGPLAAQRGAAQR